jgi:glycosyltransferase involved in cell wall biosynthesis
MLSTDTFNMGGVQSGQCAALNTIMIGSNTDYQKVLFPDLVGIDPDFLVDKINKLYTNKKYKEEVKQYAFESFLTNYSYKAVKQQIINLYKDLT